MPAVFIFDSNALRVVGAGSSFMPSPLHNPQHITTWTLCGPYSGSLWRPDRLILLFLLSLSFALPSKHARHARARASITSQYALCTCGGGSMLCLSLCEARRYSLTFQNRNLHFAYLRQLRPHTRATRARLCDFAVALLLLLVGYYGADCVACVHLHECLGARCFAVHTATAMMMMLMIRAASLRGFGGTAWLISPPVCCAKRGRAACSNGFYYTPFRRVSFCSSDWNANRHGVAWRGGRDAARG